MKREERKKEIVEKSQDYLLLIIDCIYLSQVVELSARTSQFIVEIYEKK